MSSLRTIELHADAPAKPRVGTPCNGCGVCCAAEPCPVALVFLLQRQGRCRALQWQAEGRRYVCGMVVAPQRFSPVVLSALAAVAGRFFAARIAAGSGCDAAIEVEPHGIARGRKPPDDKAIDRY